MADYEPDPWQEFKDGVATGLLNEDGSQREPGDPPDWWLDGVAADAVELHDRHAGKPCDCLPSEPVYGDDPPF